MNDEVILLAHGSGGKLSHDLVAQTFVRHFDNPTLLQLDDSAVVAIAGPAGGDRLPRLALSTDSYVWLMTPKVGRPGYVDPADIAEGTLTAGLALANQASVSAEWQAQKVVRPRAGRR